MISRFKADSKQTGNKLCLLILATLITGSACGSEGVGGDGDKTDQSAVYEYRGIPVFNDIELSRRYYSRAEEAQNLIAECMQEQGFDYKPESLESGFNPDAYAAILREEMSDVEFAHEFGFGLAPMQDLTIYGLSDEETLERAQETRLKHEERFIGMSEEERSGTSLRLMEGQHPMELEWPVGAQLRRKPKPAWTCTLNSTSIATKT